MTTFRKLNHRFQVLMRSWPNTLLIYSSVILSSSSRKLSTRMIRQAVIILRYAFLYFSRRFSELLYQNLQSTNWQTLRFKPPPPGSPIGWRVEFRSMEVQVTDFENAAFAVFVVLLSRAIMAFNLNFYLPISKVRQLSSACF